MIKSILLICTGNSCRSVMAEGLLRKYLEGHNCGMKVASAGIYALPGMMASSGAVEVMKGEGIDISAHRARLVTKEMIKEADLVLGMEPVHIEMVSSIVPAAKEKTHLLLEYAHGKEAGVKTNLWVVDPIGKPKEVYESVLMTLKEAIEKLGEKICG
jgi:protein-tyrosine-phosphatase